MITIDVNLKYLTDHYNIGAQQLKAYRGKSVKEIMRLEAKRGNSKAADFMFNITTDPMQLVEIFRLMNPENRYEIIKNMSFADKIKLMSKLDKPEMLLGLKFFQKEKLLQLMTGIPKPKLLAIVLEKFDFETFMKKIPEEEMDKFFDSKKIKPEQILKGICYMKPEQMAKMIENVTGVSQKDKTEKEMLATLALMQPNMLKTAVKSLEKEEKGFLICCMAKEEPEVMNELSPVAFVAPLEELEKNDILEAMLVLDEEDIMPMLSELPEDLMAVTASQLEPVMFSQILSQEFGSIINQLYAA